MKKIIVVIFGLTFLMTLATSCSDAKITDAVVVEQINVLSGKEDSYKYEVKLRVAPNSNDAYFYTDFRFQVGDTLISFYQFFEGKNQDIKMVRRENDSLKKELITTKYYLEILKERVFPDTIKRK